MSEFQAECGTFYGVMQKNGGKERETIDRARRYCYNNSCFRGREGELLRI